MEKLAMPPTKEAIATDQEKLEKAVDEYYARQDRTRHPAGHFDNGGRFYLSETERRPCCEGIREPSRQHPNSLNTHCRSILHIAALFDVPETDLRRAVRAKRDDKLRPE